MRRFVWRVHSDDGECGGAVVGFSWLNYRGETRERECESRMVCIYIHTVIYRRRCNDCCCSLAAVANEWKVEVE